MLAVAVLLCGTGRAGAESIAYTVPLSTKFQDGFPPRFNPTLGTLTEVDFSASGNYGGTFLVGGSGDATGRRDGTYERTIGFLFETGNPWLELSDRQTGLPFSAQYGLTTISDTFRVAQTLTSSLGGLVGTGTYNLQSNISIVTDDGTQLRPAPPSGGLSGTATVTYVYTAAPSANPEPASLVMAGTASVVGLVIWWRRRKGAVA